MYFSLKEALEKNRFQNNLYQFIDQRPMTDYYIKLGKYMHIYNFLYLSPRETMI